MRQYLSFVLGLIALAVVARVLMSVSSGSGSAAAIFMSALKPVALVYLAFFGNQAAGFFLAFILFLALVVMTVLFWQGHVRKARFGLDPVIAKLSRIATAPGSPDALPAIVAAMRSTPLLAEDWSAFETTLIRRVTPQGELVQSSARPSSFFSMHTLEAHGVNVRMFRPVPNYFVGAGLLFTFMGLVAGLYFASQGMKTANLNEARDALVRLMSASTLKFVTSIVGVGASLVFSIAVRLGSGLVEKRLVRICKLLERHLPLVTSEALIQDQLDETKRQISTLQQLDGAMRALTAAVNDAAQRGAPA